MKLRVISWAACELELISQEQSKLEIIEYRASQARRTRVSMSWTKNESSTHGTSIEQNRTERWSCHTHDPTSRGQPGPICTGTIIKGPTPNSRHLGARAVARTCQRARAFKRLESVLARVALGALRTPFSILKFSAVKVALFVNHVHKGVVYEVARHCQKAKLFLFHSPTMMLPGTTGTILGSICARVGPSRAIQANCIKTPSCRKLCIDCRA
jgi:hypothetical protein